MSVRRWLSAGLAMAVLATCVAYLVWHMERVTAASHYGAARVEALLAASSTLQTHVLTARAGLELSFDDLNESLLALRSVSTQAARARALGPDYTRSADELAQAADALRGEESAIENFKTDLALLRLSSQYFPVAADALARRAEPACPKPSAGQARTDRHREASDQNEAASAALSGLRTDVERYEAAPTRELAKRLEAAIVTISAMRTSWGDDDANRADLSVLLGHTRVILDRRERVDAFARNFVRSPVRLHLEAARAAYERAARQPLGATSVLRLLASLLAMLGFLAFGIAAWRAAREAPAK